MQADSNKRRVKTSKERSKNIIDWEKFKNAKVSSGL
jgi:hypothetical protein